MQSRPTVGSKVRVQAIREIGIIVNDAHDHVPYQIRGFDGELLLGGMFFRECDVVELQPHVCAGSLADSPLQVRVGSPSGNIDSPRLQQRVAPQEQEPSVAHADRQARAREVVSTELEPVHVQLGSSSENADATIRTHHMSRMVDTAAVSYICERAENKGESWTGIYTRQSITNEMHSQLAADAQGLTGSKDLRSLDVGAQVNGSSMKHEQVKQHAWVCTEAMPSCCAPGASSVTASECPNRELGECADCTKLQELGTAQWNRKPGDQRQQHLLVSAVSHRMLTSARCPPVQVPQLHKVLPCIKSRLSALWAFAVQTQSAGSWFTKWIRFFAVGIGLGLTLAQSTKRKGWRAAQATLNYL